MALTRASMQSVHRFVTRSPHLRLAANPRCFSTVPAHPSRATPKLAISLHRGLRKQYTQSSLHRAVGQEAPSAKSYINSGVVAGAKNPVGVKKVLVIGSGGLSIGQAGEFDYSGRSR